MGEQILAIGIFICLGILVLFIWIMTHDTEYHPDGCDCEDCTFHGWGNPY